MVLVRRRRSGRNKSILDFVKDTSKSQVKVEEEKTGASIEGKRESKVGTGKNNIIDELLEFVVSKKEVVEETAVETSKPDLEELGEAEVPSGEVLDTILSKSVEDIRCDSTGKCNDGRYIGEIFTDRYGFKRQRGFVNTTRLPVFLDWIVEEATIQQVLPRAYSLKTNRGSVALVPEDFLCELHTRYGVLLKNYEKCSNYKPSLTRETRRIRKR